MAGAWTTLSIKDGGGTSRTMRVWDESGSGAGPFSFAQTIADLTGAGSAVIKAPSTAALTTDESLVVALSPNIFGQATYQDSLPVTMASNQPAIDVNISTGVEALWFLGSSNNGLMTNALTLMSTDLNSLGSGSAVTSSVAGTSGLLTNANTAGAIWAEIFFKPGSFTPSTNGANISGWFLQSYDGGTHFELGGSGNTVVPVRPADFVIPVPVTALTAGNSVIYKAIAPVMLPTLNFYICTQNNTGASLAASGSTMLAAPIAPIY